MTDMDTGKYLLTEQGLKYLGQFKVDGRRHYRRRVWLPVCAADV